MSKKTLFQIFLSSLVVLIFVSVFQIYFNKKDKMEKKISNQLNSDNVEKAKSNSSSSNLIQNIEYSSKDSQGNKYNIVAKYGEIDLKDTDMMLLTDVTATIKSRNYSVIKIRSDFAKYNNDTYNTNFLGNVLLTYENHKINSNNLDLSLKNNLITFFDNIIYKNENSTMLSDRIEIDLLTKNVKILNDSNYKKVKIFTKR